MENVKTQNSLNGLALVDQTDSGRPAKSRIQDADQCRTLVGQVREQYRERGRFEAKVQGMFDGNPPYSSARLRNSGQANVTNINFLEAKAQSSQAMVPYYDLFSGSKFHAQLCVNLDAPAYDTQRWSQTLTEKFEKLITGCEDFDWNMQQMLNEFVRYGKGFLMWDKDWDWRFRYIRHTRVRVPDGTRCFVDNLELLCVAHNYMIHELWRMIENKEEAIDAGWNPEEVAAAISGAMPDLDDAVDTDPLSYERVQDRLKDRDVYPSMTSRVVRANHVFVREFDGKVSHFIVCEDRATAPGGKERKADFLYKKESKFNKFSEVICPFFYETEDGSWNGARGLGHMIYSVMELKNRLRCAMVDNAMIQSGITLVARDANSINNASLVQLGRLNIIPPDFNVQQSNVLADFRGPIEVNRELDLMTSRNTGVYHVRQEKIEGNPITATQAQLDMQQQVILGNSAINRFMGTLDRFYAEIYRRVLKLANDDKAAKEFVQSCIADGVPAEAFRTVTVRAYRNIGNGSMYMRQQQIQALGPLVPMMPETGKSNWLDDAIASNTNQDLVSRYNPKPNESSNANDHQWAAMLENAALKDSAPITITESQNHVVHVQTHTQAMAQSMASVQQGANPVAVIQFLEGAGPHVVAHLEALKANPTKKQEYALLSKQFAQLQATVDKFIQTTLAAMEQNSQEQSAPAEPESGGVDPTVIKAAADSQIKMQKWEQQKTINADKAKQKLAINDAMTAQKMANTQKQHALNQAMAVQKSAQAPAKPKAKS